MNAFALLALAGDGMITQPLLIDKRVWSLGENFRGYCSNASLSIAVAAYGWVWWCGEANGRMNAVLAASAS